MSCQCMCTHSNNRFTVPECFGINAKPCIVGMLNCASMKTHNWKICYTLVDEMLRMLISYVDSFGHDVPHKIRSQVCHEIEIPILIFFLEQKSISMWRLLNNDWFASFNDVHLSCNQLNLRLHASRLALRLVPENKHLLPNSKYAMAMRLPLNNTSSWGSSGSHKLPHWHLRFKPRKKKSKPKVLASQSFLDTWRASRRVCVTSAHSLVPGLSRSRLGATLRWSHQHGSGHVANKTRRS